MKSKEVYDILIRYLVIFLSALPHFWIFYFIFTPLTIYPVYFLLKIFFDVSLSGNIISVSDYSIEIINACVAGSAYYALLVLNLSIPKIKIKKRIKMLLFAFVSLLTINILRILFLSILWVSGSSFFDITHKLFWYFLSTIFVVLIWFTEVRIFKIKEIPFYSDLSHLFKHSILKK
ncbi:MAG: pacearchaeosortase [archaeon]